MRRHSALVELDCGDPVDAWAALGFVVDLDVVAIGPVAVRCDGGGGGLRGWTLAGDDGPPDVDGIPTAWVPPGTHDAGGERPLDHVVLLTDSLERSVSALVEVGGDERRRDAPLAFVRLGEVIVEVVEREGASPHLRGIVAVVDDLSELPADLVGEPRDAVQPGRRIVTVSRAAGLETAVAFMTPRARTR